MTSTSFPGTHSLAATQSRSVCGPALLTSALSLGATALFVPATADAAWDRQAYEHCIYVLNSPNYHYQDPFNWQIDQCCQQTGGFLVRGDPGQNIYPPRFNADGHNDQCLDPAMFPTGRKPPPGTPPPPAPERHS